MTNYSPHSRSRFAQLLLGLVAVVALGGCTLPTLPGRDQGALHITSSSDTYSISLDDAFIGQTPLFDQKIKTGEYTLKLTNIADSAQTWQTKVKINQRTLTVINYHPGSELAEASSQILYLQPLGDQNNTRLSISTLPDNTIVTIDGQNKGFAPMSLSDLPAGEYQLKLQAPGFMETVEKIKLTNNYHLVVLTELGRDLSLKLELPEVVASPSATPSPIPTTNSDTLPTTSDTTPDETTPFGQVSSGINQGYGQAVSGLKLVKILSSGSGINWLRVRSEPSGLTNNEVARVQVDQFYPHLSDSDNNQWRQIEYAPGKTGWVAIQYTSPTRP